MRRMLLLVLLAGAAWLLSGRIGDTAALAAEAAMARAPGLDGPGGLVMVLVIGKDQDVDRLGQASSRHARADVLKVVALDFHNHRIRVLSIPRDTMVVLPRWGRQKVNAPQALGGTGLQLQTVGELLGVPIQRRLVVTQAAVAHAVDALGGLPIQVDEAMDYDDNWGGLHLHLKPGLQTLAGRDLVGYCRYRRGPDGDLGRIRRQAGAAKALASRLKDPATWLQVPDAFRVARTELETDLTREEMLVIARRAALERWSISSRTVPTSPLWVGGVAYQVHDSVATSELVRDFLLGLERPRRVRVLNATKIPGLAAGTAGRLRALGYPPPEIGNSPSVPPGVEIRYGPGHEKEAVSLARLFRQPRLIGSASGDLDVILGSSP